VIAHTKLALIVGAVLVATAGLTAATGALDPRSIWGSDNPGQGTAHAAMSPAGEEHNRAGLNHSDDRGGNETGDHGDDNETDDHGDDNETADSDDNETADNDTDEQGSNGGNGNETADNDDNETDESPDAGTSQTLTAESYVATSYEPMAVKAA